MSRRSARRDSGSATAGNAPSRRTDPDPAGATDGSAHGASGDPPAGDDDPVVHSVLVSHEGRKWCAVHTRARHEKKVEAACGALHIPSYLPLQLSQTYSGGKVNRFHVPVFPGYVFAALSAGDLYQLKRTNSVAQKIEPRDDGPLIADLLNVRRVERAHVALQLTSTFTKGDRVVVIEGPLVGTQGLVVRYQNRTHLVVAVQAINQAIMLEVPAEHVQLVVDPL